MVPPYRRACGGLEPAGRALGPAGRASEPAGRALEPAGRALDPAGRPWEGGMETTNMENIPVWWFYRSSSPMGPLPKKGG